MHDFGSHQEAYSGLERHRGVIIDCSATPVSVDRIRGGLLAIAQRIKIGARYRNPFRKLSIARSPTTHLACEVFKRPHLRAEVRIPLYFISAVRAPCTAPRSSTGNLDRRAIAELWPISGEFPVREAG